MVENNDSTEMDLTNAVEAQLSKIAGVEPQVSTSNDGDNSTDSEQTNVPEAKEGGETTASEEKAKETESGTTSEENSEKESEEVNIPDAYIRAAVHQGWSKEDVVGLWKQDQPLAEKTLGRILESTNRLSIQYGQIGQTIKQPEQKVAAKQQTAVETTTDFDTSKIEEIVDDPELYKTVVKPLMNAVSSLKNEMVQIQQQQKTVSDAMTSQQNTDREDKLKGIQVDVDKFFGGFDSKVMKEYYGEGDNWTKLTAEQQNNRNAVLVSGDQQIAGAAYHGKQINNVEAMNLAHMQLTAHIAETEIMERIKDTVTKRESSLSLGAVSSKKDETKASEKTDESATIAVEQFMKERGIQQY